MPLPGIVKVKLSSEAAGYVTLTPVVVEELALDQLLETILGVTGPDPVRVAEILRRGSLVSGSTRFRWTGLDATVEEIVSSLARLPKAEPQRPFVRERALRVILTGPRTRIEITRESGSRRRLLGRRSFWDALLDLPGEPAYHDYLYKERADCYRMPLSDELAGRLTQSAGLIAFPALTAQVRATRIDFIDWLLPR